MNLTDGTILCGRKYFDGEFITLSLPPDPLTLGVKFHSSPQPPGSGGNNHAVEYYDTTKYPLAVKLGTITPDGADVYSYDEDDMVLDPKLNEHLAHFGIDIASMTKVCRAGNHKYTIAHN